MTASPSPEQQAEQPHGYLVVLEGGFRNPFKCGRDCCDDCLIFVPIFLILLVLGGFIFVIISSPSDPVFEVNNAILTRFTLSPTNNKLSYNLAVNMTTRNPNRYSRIFYDEIETTATYHGKQFAIMGIEGFCLEPKKENSNVSVVYESEQKVVFGDDENPKYDSENKDGRYDIELKLTLQMMYKKSDKFKSIVVCGLKVPLSYEGSKGLSAKFERTRCSFKVDEDDDDDSLASSIIVTLMIFVLLSIGYDQ